MKRIMCGLIFMSMYDSLIARLECPEKRVSSDIEIQFKWSDSLLDTYRIGDQLESGPYGNIWIHEDYLCMLCSETEPAMLGGKPFGTSIKKSVYHAAFMHIDNGKILDVLSENEFKAKYVKEDLQLPKGESLHIDFVKYDNLPDFLKPKVGTQLIKN